MTSATSWATSILAGLGAPASANNLQKLAAWNACEGNLNGGSGLGINNPFNTTLDYGGGTSVNGAGVKDYPSISVGVQATLMTLGDPRYAAVVANLKADGPGGEFAGAVGSSGWGTSGSCIANTLGTAAVAPANGTAALTAATTGGAASSSATAQQNQSKDVSRMNLVTAIATYGPGILSNEDLQKKLKVGGSASSILSKVPGLGGLFTAGSDVISGTEVAAGILAWLTKPSTLLRAAEVALGAGLLAVGGSLYLRILMPAAGGIIGGIAAAATPVGRAASIGGGVAAATGRGAVAGGRKVASAIPDKDDRAYKRALKNPGPTTMPKPTSVEGPNQKRLRPVAAAGASVHRTHNELGEEYF